MPTTVVYTIFARSAHSCAGEENLSSDRKTGGMREPSVQAGETDFPAGRRAAESYRILIIVRRVLIDGALCGEYA